VVDAAVVITAAHIMTRRPATTQNDGAMLSLLVSATLAAAVCRALHHACTPQATLTICHHAVTEKRVQVAIVLDTDQLQWTCCQVRVQGSVMSAICMFQAQGAVTFSWELVVMGDGQVVQQGLMLQAAAGSIMLDATIQEM